MKYGVNSSDEMADLWLQVVPVRESDRDRLVADLRRKLVPQHLDGYRKMLDAQPDNATASVALPTDRRWPEHSRWVAVLVERSKQSPGQRCADFTHS